MSVNVGVLMILIKKTMPTFLRIIEDRLIGMFSAPRIIKEVNNANQKGFEHDYLKRNRRVKIHATLQKTRLPLSLAEIKLEIIHKN